MKASLWALLYRFGSTTAPELFRSVGTRGAVAGLVVLIGTSMAWDPTSSGGNDTVAPELRPAPSHEEDRIERAAGVGTPLPIRPDRPEQSEPAPAAPDGRRRPSVDHLPPPADDAFHGTVGPVPPEVVERTTWGPECPVGLEDLRYLTLSFWGFDDRPHTGELIVHASEAEGVLGVFRRMHELRFPIEEMRVVSRSDLESTSPGDGNNTSGFVCRSAAGSSSWSEHARGLAVDVNPFHNPYVRGDVVIPALATSYTDRARPRPGMVTPEVIAAFEDIGWGWGGHWESLTDPMHFSATGD